MKSNRIVAAAVGVLLFLSIVLTTVWLFSPAKPAEDKVMSTDQLVNLINNKQVKEVDFKQSRVRLTDLNGSKYYANVAGESDRESLLASIKNHNKINTSAPIKYNEEPVSSGLGAFNLTNSLAPLLFFIMWGLTLAVIVYAVRTLSRNKS